MIPLTIDGAKHKQTTCIIFRPASVNFAFSDIFHPFKSSLSPHPSRGLMRFEILKGNRFYDNCHRSKTEQQVRPQYKYPAPQKQKFRIAATAGDFFGLSLLFVRNSPQNRPTPFFELTFLLLP